MILYLLGLSAALNLLLILELRCMHKQWQSTLDAMDEMMVNDQLLVDVVNYYKARAQSAEAQIDQAGEEWKKS